MSQGFYVICYRCGSSCRLVGPMGDFWKKDQRLQCDNCGNFFPELPTYSYTLTHLREKSVPEIIELASINYEFGLSTGRIGADYVYIVLNKADVDLFKITTPNLLNAFGVIVIRYFPHSNSAQIDYCVSKSFDTVGEATEYIHRLLGGAYWE